MAMKKGKLSEEALEFFRAQGKRGGKMGAKARLKKMTPEQRTAVAKKAAAASAKVRSAKAKLARPGRLKSVEN